MVDLNTCCTCILYASIPASRNENGTRGVQVIDNAIIASFLAFPFTSGRRAISARSKLLIVHTSGLALSLKRVTSSEATGPRCNRDELVCSRGTPPLNSYIEGMCTIVLPQSRGRGAVRQGESRRSTGVISTGSPHKGIPGTLAQGTCTWPIPEQCLLRAGES